MPAVGIGPENVCNRIATHGARNVLRGVTAFVLFIAGFSLFLELGERYHWVEPVYIELAVTFLLADSLRCCGALRGVATPDSPVTCSGCLEVG